MRVFFVIGILREPISVAMGLAIGTAQQLCHKFPRFDRRDQCRRSLNSSPSWASPQPWAPAPRLHRKKKWSSFRFSPSLSPANSDSTPAAARTSSGLIELVLKRSDPRHVAGLAVFLFGSIDWAAIVRVAPPTRTSVSDPTLNPSCRLIDATTPQAFGATGAFLGHPYLAVHQSDRFSTGCTNAASITGGAGNVLLAPPVNIRRNSDIGTGRKQTSAPAFRTVRPFLNFSGERAC